MPQRLFFVLMTRRPPSSPLFPYTTLFRSALAPRTRLTSCLVAGALIAATLLTKLSNLPIVVALLATVGTRLSRPGARHELRDLLALVTTAVVPVAAWSARVYLVFGDVTGQYQ